MPYRSIFRPSLFADQAAVVTGAGSGIGRAVAHELSSLGARLALVGRQQEKLDRVRQELLAAGRAEREISVHVCDIRDEALVNQTISAITSAHGRIDALVNNAGGQFVAPLETISANGWDAVVRNNLTGGFFMAKACVNQGMKEHGGAMVNMLADMWHGMPGMGHSGAARAGMLNFTETAAAEWARFGIRVNAVAPGWIDSSGMQQYPEAVRANLSALKQVVPLRRMGTESEVASTIVFLLSPGASFITGTCVRVDGGVPNARHTWPTQAQAQAGASAAYDGYKSESKSNDIERR